MSDAAAQCALISQPTLFVVATPIGNLNDIAPRARQVLAQVHRVAAEDTCNTGTPAVSDPGAALVYAAAQAGFDVVPVPVPAKRVLLTKW